MIAIKNLHKSFDSGSSYVVKDVSLEIPKNSTMVLLGSSGCGKTTLLKMINRLIEPSSGRIYIENREVQEYNPIELKRAIGYAFQEVGLFPHMSVGDNITVALDLMGFSKKQQTKRAHELLECVNLDPCSFFSRFPNELSGGQQQRVGVARALATYPKYLLMDEPFGALDAINRDSLQEEMAGIRDRFRTTVLFVTHDLFEAIRLGDLIAVMNQGVIEQIGTASELINYPKTPFVSNLFQKPLDQLKLYRSEVK